MFKLLKSIFKRKKYPQNCKYCVYCSTRSSGPHVLTKYCNRKKMGVYGHEAKKCRLIRWKK